METTFVTSKGQVTIPMALRQRLGIRQGSRIDFSLVDNHIEMLVKTRCSATPGMGSAC